MRSDHGVGVRAAQRHRGLPQQRTAAGHVGRAGAQVDRQIQIQARYPQRGDHIIGQTVAGQVKGGRLVGKGILQAALSLGKNLRIVGLQGIVQFGVSAGRLGVVCGFGHGGGGSFGSLHKFLYGFCTLPRRQILADRGLQHKPNAQQYREPCKNLQKQAFHQSSSSRFLQRCNSSSKSSASPPMTRLPVTLIHGHASTIRLTTLPVCSS